MTASHVVTVLVLQSLVQSTRQPTGCGAGFSFLGWSKEGLVQCQQCPEGTFMDEYNHFNYNCTKCQDVQLSSCVKVLNECRPESNTKIECKDTCYKETRPLEENCKLCSLCQEGEYLTRNCTKTSDTVCCPFPNMIVVDDNSNTADTVPRCENQTLVNTTTTNEPTVENTTRNGTLNITSDDGSDKMSGGAIAGIVCSIIIVAAVVVVIVSYKSRKPPLPSPTPV